MCNVNTLRPRQNDHRFPDVIFKRTFLNDSVWISLNISMKFVPKVRINNILALVEMMALIRPGHKPLSEPMIVSLLTYISVIRPQWVNGTIMAISFKKRPKLFGKSNNIFRYSLSTAPLIAPELTTRSFIPYQLMQNTCWMSRKKTTTMCPGYNEPMSCINRSMRILSGIFRSHALKHCLRKYIYIYMYVIAPRTLSFARQAKTW